MAEEKLKPLQQIVNCVGAFLRSVYWVSEYAFATVAIHFIYAFLLDPTMLDVRIAIFVVATSIPLVFVEGLLTSCWRQIRTRVNPFMWCIFHLTVLSGAMISTFKAFVPRGAYSHAMLIICINGMLAIAIASLVASPSFGWCAKEEKQNQLIDSLRHFSFIACIWLPQCWVLMVLDVMVVENNSGLATFICFLQLVFVGLLVFIKWSRKEPAVRLS